MILAGVHKAFEDLRDAGLDRASFPAWSARRPRSSSAIHDYIVTGHYRNAVHPATVADSISVSVPSNAHLARAAVLLSRGCSVTVSDAEILGAQRTLAATSGVFAEPAAAAAVAALASLRDGGLLRRATRSSCSSPATGSRTSTRRSGACEMPAAIAPTAGASTASPSASRKRGPRVNADGAKGWRNDAHAKVTGRTKYTDDLKFARLLHAAPVYSDFVHARILRDRRPRTPRGPPASSGS